MGKKKINEDEADDDSTWVACPNRECDLGVVTDKKTGRRVNCTDCGGWGQVPI